MSRDSLLRQRVSDLTFMQKWRSENCHPAGENFSLVEQLIDAVRRQPLVEAWWPVRENMRKATGINARPEVVLAVFNALMDAWPSNSVTDRKNVAGLTEAAIKAIEARGVDLS